MTNWEQAKVIIDFILSLTILYATFKGSAFFKYKTDSTIRDLYIDNAQQVEDILGKFYANAIVEWEDINKLNKAYREATLYLHKDIVRFIETLREYLCKIIVCNHRLEPLPIGEERNRLCEEIYEMELKINTHTKNFYQLYRKQILQDNFEIKNLKFWDKDICKK